MKCPLSVVILTFNEEANLGACLETVATWVSQVVVLDSGSTDETQAIAHRYTEHVYEHAFAGYPEQRNYALEHLPLEYEWVFFLDADERVTPELRDELRALFQDGPPTDVSGYYVKRRYIFMGRWIKHCGWYPVWLLRLFDRHYGRYEGRAVGEHVVLDGHAAYLEHDIVHENLKGMHALIEKHNRYSSKEALEILRVLERRETTGFRPSFLGDPVQRKRAIRERIWMRLPARFLFLFLYMYIFRLGFLDGKPGLYWCLFQSAHQFHISLKLEELRHKNSWQKWTQ